MKYINKGCKGHYWTEALTREEMTATDDDIREYERSLQGLLFLIFLKGITGNDYPQKEGLLSANQSRN